MLLSVLAIGLGIHARAQDAGKSQYIGVTATYAPNSSHILIGDAEKRRIWTAGIVYDRSLWRDGSIRLDYEAGIDPFFQERDPTLIAICIGGSASAGCSPVNPQRVITVSKGSNSSVFYDYGAQYSYGGSATPLGVRVSAGTSRRIQPTFSINTGFILSGRDLPVDNSASFNYLFSFGPGFQVNLERHMAVRVEYLYRHISNAGSGNLNPGIDQGVFRLSVLRGFH